MQEETIKDLTAENNQVLKKLFKIAALPVSLENMLEQCLDLLLSLSWLSLLPKGGIFLVSADKSTKPILNLVVEKNLGKQISTLCAQVAFGHCLCGRAALTKKPIHTSCVDERHETRFDGMDEHGHYNIPILAGERLLGVLLFYLPHGTQHNERQLNFLVRCASILALAIELRWKERQLKAINQELIFQKKTLDQHAIVSITDIKGNITYANEKFCKISDYTLKELLGKNHRILKSGEHSTEFYVELWRTITRGHVWHGEIKNKKKNGDYYWVSATIVPFLNERGKPFQYVAIRTDITEWKSVEYALKQAQSVAKIGSWCLNLVTDQLMWSDEIFNIFGMNPKDFNCSFAAFLETIHPDDLEYVKEQYQKSLDGELLYDIEHRIIRKDNREIRWVHEKCVHQRNPQGEIIRSDGTVQDITERKFAEQEIQRLAMTDQLTGLANRNQFHRRFNESLKLALRGKMKLVLMLLDLDRFKPVNDTYGHQVGDSLLQAVAAIFKRHARETDIVARLGGDEFAIVLVNPDSVENAKKCAERIICEVKKSIILKGYEIKIGTSIGLATFPDDGTEEDELIHKADLALYEAKHLGRNTYRFYSFELNR